MGARQSKGRQGNTGRWQMNYQEALKTANRLREAGAFDAAWYLEEYPDVFQSGMDPVLHYVLHGQYEGRQPSPSFPNSGEQEWAIDEIAYPQSGAAAGYPLFITGMDNKAVNLEIGSLRLDFTVHSLGNSNSNQGCVAIECENAQEALACVESFFNNCGFPCAFHIFAKNGPGNALQTMREFASGGCSLQVFEPAQKKEYANFLARGRFAIFLIMACLAENQDKVLAAHCSSRCLNSLRELFAVNPRESIFCASRDWLKYVGYGQSKRIFAPRTDIVLLNCSRLRSLAKSLIGSMDKLDTARVLSLPGVDWLELSPLFNFLPEYTALEGMPRSILGAGREKARIVNDARPKDDIGGAFNYITERFCTTATGFGHCRENSVLLVEAADCHSEHLCGYAHYFRQRGFNVDAIMCDDNYRNNPFCRMTDPGLRIFHLPLEEMYRFFDSRILEPYQLLFVNTRSLYKQLEGLWHPDIFTFYPVLEKYRHKTICIEHHLEYLESGNRAGVLTLVSLGHAKVNPAMTALVPYYGNIRGERKLSRPVRFLVAGSIEQQRKNFRLLLETIADLAAGDFIVDVVSKRGNLDIPPSLADKIRFHQNLPFDELFSLAEKANFALPLLDAGIPEHNRYLTRAFSGTFQYVYGFRTPCLIQAPFAEANKMNGENSIIYADNAAFGEALRRAINMSANDYERMVANLGLLCGRIMEQSFGNLDGQIRRMMPWVKLECKGDA